MQLRGLVAVLLVGSGVARLSGDAGNKRPITSSEKQAVGAALTHALGVMSGKSTGGSKYGTCADYFSDGAPSDPKTNVMWQSCKGVLGESWGKKKRSALLNYPKHFGHYEDIKIRNDGSISEEQKDQISDALEDAMGDLGGKKSLSAKGKMCAEQFKEGPPEDLHSEAWVECKEELPSNYFGSSVGKMMEMMGGGRSRHHHR